MRAPASTSSPIFLTMRSLIVSPAPPASTTPSVCAMDAPDEGSTSISYSTPPGVTTLPFRTFSISTALVAQMSQLYPGGSDTRALPELGAASPHQYSTSAAKRPSCSIHWQRVW